MAALTLDPDAKGVSRLLDGARKAKNYIRERKAIEQQRRHLQEINGQLATATLLTLYENQQKYEDIGAQLLAAVAATPSEDDVDKAIACARELEVQKLRSRIIDSLYFPEISQRSSAIETAYPSTYEWALRDDTSEVRPWLQAGCGIFWISGKAGSCKSTLMNFLFQHDETKRLLGTWCRGTAQNLVLAKHYFWYAGTSLQKSTSGLIRTILHQILQPKPGLVDVAFPALFATIDKSKPLEWIDDHLLASLKTLASSGLRPQDQYCFFIDGLDEFHGNHTKLVAVLTDMVQNENIKLCVSSRPWTAFRHAFATEKPTLRLEDLTRPDVHRYVEGEIRSALRQCHYVRSDAMNQEIDLLISEIVSKVEGVFLWVVLVVKSVAEELTQHDPISMLRHRVRDFPADLGNFFRDMLSRVHSVYKMQTRQALKLACMYSAENGPAKAASTFVDYWLICQQPDGLADDTFPYAYPARGVSLDEWDAMRADTRATLSAACKDLLCLPKNSTQVEFLHRTV